MSVSFNLVDQKWIPVLYEGGSVERVGILKALEDASRIRQIAASNPMDRVAILRFLLAVLYWCKGDSPADMNANGVDSFPPEWLAQLDENKASFNLLGVKGGFYQDHETKGVRVSAANLLHDLPSGINIAHFRHIRDGRDGICLACCALGLMRWSTAAPAGLAGSGQSMTAGINGVTPTYSIPTGATLFATLLLSRPSGDSIEGDSPVWDGATEESPLGFLKGMTWRSRRVVLAPPDADGKRDLSPGRCCHCGEQTDRLVRSILFRPGWKRQPWSDDPHLLRITRTDGKSAKAKEKRIVPSWPSPNDALENHAGVWRSIMQGLLQRSASSESRPTEFRTTLLGTSQALYKHVGEHGVVLPDLASDVAQRLLDELKWLKEVTWGTIAARGGNWRDPPRGHRLVGTVCAPGAKGHAVRSSLCARSALAECELEEAFQSLVQDLSTADEPDGQAIVQDWRARASGVLRRYAGKSVHAAKSGSPLRKREAKRRADNAILEAVSQIDPKRGASK